MWVSAWKEGRERWVQGREAREREREMQRRDERKEGRTGNAKSVSSIRQPVSRSDGKMEGKERESG